MSIKQILSGFCLFALLTAMVFLDGERSTNTWRHDPTSGYRPSDWFFAQRAFPSGQVDQQAYKQAVAYRQRVERRTINSPYRSETSSWEAAGPTNIGGRVTDIEMPPSSFNRIYVGSASGGLFLTEDQGKSWAPIFDDAPSLSIGDIALAPSREQILYVGTGEPNAGGGSLTYDGNGVYRSDDGGATWRHLGLENTGSIGRIAVHPQNPDIAYVAAMGRLFENNPERGLYKTTDGGRNWERVLFLSDSTGVIDVAIHPTQPNTIFAAAWERIRRPQRRSYGGATSGIYRSTDGGRSWEALSEGLPEHPSDKGRIGIALAPSNPSTVYAAYADALGNFEGFFSSKDGGDTWQRKSDRGLTQTSFMWWFGRVAVDPSDEELAYFTSLLMHQTRNGGNTWDLIFFGAHVDQHAVYIHPGDPSFVVIGNDGGVYLSRDRGSTMTKLDGLPITQFYTCAQDFQQTEVLYGGTQDNGNMRTPTGAEGDWEIILDGDGFYNLIDPQDSRYLYSETQYGRLWRSTNGGASFQRALSGIAVSDRRNWNTPVIFDPSDPAVLYYGANRLYRSTDRAESWQAISPDLTDGDGEDNLVFGTITTIDVSPLDPDLIYVGTDDGNVWRTTDGGRGWQRLSDALPRRWVTRVVADPENRLGAYVTLSGYRFGENMTHIYRTEDGGLTWRSIAGNLPDVPVNDLIVHPELSALYIATDIGVFKTVDEGQSWAPAASGMPNVVVTDLLLHLPTQQLIAATYGRSMYRLQLETTSANDEVPIARAQLKIGPNPFREETTVYLEFSSGEWVNIFLFDNAGKVMRRIFSGELPAGPHRFEVPGQELPAGTYVCVITDQQGRKISGVKIVRQ